MTISSEGTNAPVAIASVLLSVFVLAEVNYPFLTPQSQLAVFGGLGLVLIFLQMGAAVYLRRLAALAAGLAFGFIAVQSESLFSGLWLDSRSLGERAGQEATADYLICLLYTSPSPRDRTRSRMPSSA